MQRLFAATGSTNSSGVGVTSILVPGTFSGGNQNSPTFQGRRLIWWHLWFATPLAGDYISSLTVTDTDGVIPVPARAAFPNYPIVATKIDSQVASGNQVVYLPLIEPIHNTDGVLIPSGLYLSLGVQKASAVVDNFYVNIGWDDFT